MTSEDKQRHAPGTLMQYEEISDEEFERLEREGQRPGRKTWDGLVLDLEDDKPVRFPADSEAQANHIAHQLRRSAGRQSIPMKVLVIKGPPALVVAKKEPLYPEPSKPIANATPVDPQTLPLDATQDPELCGFEDPLSGARCTRKVHVTGGHSYTIDPPPSPRPSLAARNGRR